MAAKTGTQLQSAVQSHLGNRDSGTIGGVAIGDAVLDSINKAGMKITQPKCVHQPWDHHVFY